MTASRSSSALIALVLGCVVALVTLAPRIPRNFQPPLVDTLPAVTCTLNEVVILSTDSRWYQCTTASPSSWTIMSSAGAGTVTAGRSLTLVAESMEADAELFTQIRDTELVSPTTADVGKIQLTFPSAATITRIWCSTDTGTATIQFDERAEATPNTAGVDVMTSTLVCDADSQATTTFTNAGIAAQVPLNLDVDAVASSPTKLRIHVQYTAND